MGESPTHESGNTEGKPDMLDTKQENTATKQDRNGQNRSTPSEPKHKQREPNVADR